MPSLPQCVGLYSQLAKGGGYCQGINWPWTEKHISLFINLYTNQCFTY